MVALHPVVLLVVLIGTCTPVTRAGDEVLDLSSEVDDWNPQQIQEVLAPQKDEQEEELGENEFRDAFAQANAYDDVNSPSAFRDTLAKEGQGGTGDWDSPTAFRDALAEDRRERLKTVRHTVAMLEQELQQAKGPGRKLGESYDGDDFPESERLLRAEQLEGAGSDRLGPPALDGNHSRFSGTANFSREDREMYEHGYASYRMGHQSVEHKEYEPTAQNLTINGADLSYFEQLHDKQRAAKMQEALHPKTDVLEYPYAGYYCTRLLNDQRLRVGECERSSPLRCNLKYQLCEIRTIQRGVGKWMDVVPEASCEQDADCEMNREEQEAELNHQRYLEEDFGPLAKVAKQAAQTKMEERDRARRKRAERAREEANEAVKQALQQADQAVEDATLFGNAPLPTERIERQERRLLKHMTDQRKKLKKLDARFLQLGTLSKDCHSAFVRCEKPCPHLNLLKMESDNACTLKCKGILARCVEQYISSAYKDVAATSKDIKAAMRNRRSKEILSKAANKKQPPVELGDAKMQRPSSVFSIPLPHGGLRDVINSY